MLTHLPLALLLTLMICASVFADESRPTLGEQLAEKAAESKKNLPPEMQQRFERGIEEVRETGIEDSAKNVGDKAVDAALMSWSGEQVKLSDMWADGPVVLTWYRGGWCPYCNLSLQALEKSLNKIEGAGAKLVALTPELPENARDTAEKNNLSFLVLHDKESRVAHEYGILFTLPEAIAPIYRDRLQLPKVNGYDKLELPMAATYVIDRQGVIRWAFLDADYKKRAEPAEVVEAINQLHSKEE